MTNRLIFSLFSIALFCLAANAGFSQNSGDSPTTGTSTKMFPPAGTTRVVDLPDVQEMLKKSDTSLLVVNFWATWCGPCVEELPSFIKASKEYKEGDVRFLGISADFKSEIDTRVIPFLKKHDVPYSNVVFFGKSDDMINFFSEEWKGDLPATFFYDQNGKELAKFLRPVTYEELKEKISALRPK